MSDETETEIAPDGQTQLTDNRNTDFVARKTEWTAKDDTNFAGAIVTLKIDAMSDSSFELEDLLGHIRKQLSGPKGVESRVAGDLDGESRQITVFFKFMNQKIEHKLTRKT